MPKIEEYLRPDVIQKVARLDLKARFIVEGFLSGLHESPYHGFSSEFSEHRRYSVGDDLKELDWNVYAHTDRFYIKKFEAETNLNTYLLVDVSPSMAYSYGRAVTKLQYATYLAAALGYLMLRQQDAVGLATFDTDVLGYIPPGSRRTHLAGLLGLLASSAGAGKRGASAQAPARGPKDGSLARALHRGAELLRRRGLVILLSDLIPPPDEPPGRVVEALRHLTYRGHDVICFQVLDHAELTLPHRGPTRFVDPETGRSVKAYPDAVRREYIRQVNAFIEGYRLACGEARIDHVLVDTSVSFDRVLVSYLVARKGHF